MPTVSTVSPTGNSYVDGILSGIKWGVNSFTYSFPSSGAYYGTSYGAGEPSKGFEALTSTQQTAVRNVLSSFSAVANVTFTQITETATTHADLRFAETDSVSTAWSYYPSTNAAGGDVWLNNSKNLYDNPAKGNYAYLTILHEIGHALGLKHPHETSGSFGVMPTDRQSVEWTVMSYRSYTGGPMTGYTNETWGYPQSPMIYDIAALQKLYGANFNNNSGNSAYTWNSTTGAMSINGVTQGGPGGNKIFTTVWDGGGIDTYDLSKYTIGVVVDLQPGAWSITSTSQRAKLNFDGSKLAVGNIANALLYNNDLRSLIENAVGGSSNDTLRGNVANNSLTGNGGNDRLTGGAGNDSVNGGLGTDTATFSGTRSQYTVALLVDGSVRILDKRSGSPDGTDVVANVESFQFSDRTYSYQEMTTGLNADTPFTDTTTNSDRTLTGDSASNTLEGGSGNDKLYGNGGDDTLRGRAGNDLLDGGDGNDLLDGGTGADQLLGGAGTDTATYVSASFGVVADLTTAANNLGDAQGDTFNSIERLIGSTYADSLFGNSSANRLAGGDGNDTIDGRAGSDVIYGDGGNDVLIGGSGADSFDGGTGIDTASYATATTYVVADLTTTNGSIGDALNDTFIFIENLTGSIYSDTLRGNAAANVLNGLAGADKLFGRDGDDTLTGGAGNDTLDGGSGVDVAVYSGRIEDYRQTANSDGSWTITDLRSGAPDGTDRLFGIETLWFEGQPAASTPESIPMASMDSFRSGRFERFSWRDPGSIDTPLSDSGGRWDYWHSDLPIA